MDTPAKSCTVCISLFLVLVLLLPMPANGSGSTKNIEYKVKAAFMLNFAKFITWPNTMEKGKDEPFKICLLGKNQFGPALSSLERKRVGGKKVKILTHGKIDKPLTCKMIFISSSESRRVEEILMTLKGKGLVTVSDIENFAARGGMIEFVQVNGRISFIINLDALDAENLEIKASLLNLAQAVLGK